VEQQQSHYFLVDNKEALVSTSKEFSGLGNSSHLWTDDSNLIKLIAKNFEMLWMTSQSIETVKIEDENDKLKSYLETLKPSEHLLFIYKSLESKYNVLCNYLKVGLKNGEAVVYVSSEDSYRQICEVFSQFGFDLEKNEKTAALRILKFDEFYIIDGKFSVSTTIDLIRQIYEDSIEKGFKGCRIFGDMSCFYQHNLNNELIKYEKALRRTLDIPIIGMCAYNDEIFKKCDSVMEEYKELMRAHGKVVFMGQDKHMEKFEIR
jgi:hypothetical protein